MSFSEKTVNLMAHCGELGLTISIGGIFDLIIFPFSGLMQGDGYYLSNASMISTIPPIAQKAPAIAPNTDKLYGLLLGICAH